MRTLTLLAVTLLFGCATQPTEFDPYADVHAQERRDERRVAQRLEDLRIWGRPCPERSYKECNMNGHSNPPQRPVQCFCVRYSGF